MKLPYLLAALLLATPLVHAASVVDEALADYRSQGASEFDATRGQELWNKRITGDDGKPRSCSTCHGDDLSAEGKHVRTGKTIAPMAPSANPQRLTERKTIEKWFLRNCKWTLGRECSAQEKGDLLVFLHRL